MTGRKIVKLVEPTQSQDCHVPASGRAVHSFEASKCILSTAMVLSVSNSGAFYGSS